MPLRSLSNLWKSIGFRMMLWYSAIFVLSSFSVFLIAFLLLSSWLRDRDKTIVESKLNEYSALYQKNGLSSLQEALKRDGGEGNPFFVRVSGPLNKTILMHIPKDFYDEEIDAQVFTSKDLEKDTSSQHWTLIQSSVDPEDSLDVASSLLPNGILLQLGKSNEGREDTLDNFLDFYAGVFFAVLIIGLLAGAFLTYRLLHPIRQIIGTTRSIIGTGNMDARVPLPRSTGELQELVRLFNSMLDKIETLIRGMKESLDNVAHELRSPVARLRGAAETALQTQNSYREALADCLEESDRIATMLNTLMDISEAETGTIRLQIQDLNVSLLLEDIADLYRYIAEEKNIRISTEVPTELYAKMDRNRFQQAIANLLDNAIKYTHTGGMVSLQAEQNGNGLVVRISDNGIGIAPEELAKIWDRLYRSDKSRSESGLGLGLSFVKAIVEAHNGTVDVSSVPNKGSVFSISLN